MVFLLVGFTTDLSLIGCLFTDCSLIGFLSAAFNCTAFAFDVGFRRTAFRFAVGFRKIGSGLRLQEVELSEENFPSESVSKSVAVP